MDKQVKNPMFSTKTSMSKIRQINFIPPPPRKKKEKIINLNLSFTIIRLLLTNEK